MRKLRVIAAMLAILTALIDALFCLNPNSGLSMLLPVAIGALCLALVVPFEALEPAARKRVFAACLGYIAAIGVGIWFAQQMDVGLVPVTALAALLAAGVVLAGWSFSIRNRRRRPNWAGYYDL